MLVNYTLNRRTARPRTGNVYDINITNNVVTTGSGTGGSEGGEVDLSNYMRLNSTEKQTVNSDVDFTQSIDMLGKFYLGGNEIKHNDFNILYNDRKIPTMGDFTQFGNVIPYINSNRELLPTSTTPDKLQYLNDVTGNIQEQLDRKLSLSGGTMENKNLVINLNANYLNGLTGDDYVHRTNNINEEVTGYKYFQYLTTKRGIGTRYTISGDLFGRGWSIMQDFNADVSEGLEDWFGDNRAVFDNLTVRKTFTVKELIVDKVRATNGNLYVTSAGKIRDVGKNSAGRKYIQVQFDGSGIEMNPFVKGDMLLCQVFNGAGMKRYTLQVSDDYPQAANAFYFNFQSGNEEDIAIGDDLVRIGNTNDDARKGLVYLASNGDNTPYIDTIFSGAVKARFGNLAGITYNGKKLKGYGLFGDNVYLTGEISNLNNKWQLNNDGSGFLASNNIKWDTNGNVVFGQGVKLQWDNLSDESKENLKGEQGQPGLDGLQGEKGEQGIPGEPGKDGANGKSSYFHIKYSANPNGNPMSETPNTYIGTYVDFVQADSTDYTKYTWYRFQGLQGATGEQGIPGTNGENGKTSYLHIKYSPDGKVFSANNGETPSDWIGQYTDFVQADSMDFNAYNWTKIKGETGATGPQGQPGLDGLQGEKGEQGIPGKDGANGKSSYFHIKYSANSNGNPMSETPNTYIGTYVDFVQADSTDYTKYTWYRFQGLQGATGEQGIPGTNGTNGQTSYLHIKYSNDGGVTFTSNNGETPGAWIGQYTDFNINDSTDPKKYTWAKIKGETGPQGPQGPSGESSNYPWVQDWNNNTLVQNDKILTPKIFAGTLTNNVMSGVALGSFELAGKTINGITGFDSGKEIFHLGSDYNKIGGLNIKEDGIFYLNNSGSTFFNASGQIGHINGDVHSYLLNADGSGQLASGNVNWDKDGNLKIKGHADITSGTFCAKYNYNGTVAIDGFKIQNGYFESMNQSGSNIRLSTESYYYKFGNTTRVQIGPYANGSNSCYFAVRQGFAHINMLKYATKVWNWTENGTIPTDCSVIVVKGHTGSDNPCQLAAGEDGQVIYIVNTNPSHRINITNIWQRDRYWIDDRSVGYFTYVSGYGWMGFSDYK